MELLLLLCFKVLAQILGSKGCLREERTALLDIKAFLNAYNDSTLELRLSTWVNDPTSDCCKWNHVKCDPFTNHVVKLYLQDLHVNPHSVLQYNNHSMEVSIDFSLFQNFKELRSLNLSQGGFQRLIHTEGTIYWI
ncbi:hypothetical protein L6164_000252 [Bauhinia variegata]|uniref:Uncharacterized protein n=1 Tax=Bauhinia variegata TaxID=167791 RepID=A0ACB9Q5V8_BAUVA|nr:hypothetical protein L6164_000252 [Bauhinia variegata]